MIKRIITAVIGMGVLLGLFFLFPDYAIPLICVPAAFGASYEIIKAFKKIEISVIEFIIILSCLYPTILFAGFAINGRKAIEALLRPDIILLSMFLIMLLLIMYMIFFRKYTLKDMAATLLIALYIPFLIGFIPLINFMENGRYYIWLVLIGVWAVDIFAYFTGSLIGKNHFIESISPKKTLEGFYGGILGGAIGLVVYWYFVRDIIAMSLIDVIIAGLMIGIIAQLGDWIASIIKRQTGIKDFGTVFPGHGGVLDRIDSILLSAPVIFFYLKFIVLK